jgi:hypothetical protein
LITLIAWHAKNGAIRHKVKAMKIDHSGKLIQMRAKGCD